MRAAPGFRLMVTPGRAQRTAIAMVAGLGAAVVGCWLWSHVDAAAGPAGLGHWPWVGVGLGAALLGTAVGWIGAPRAARVLAWQQGHWTLQQPPLPARDGLVQAKLDAGSWMLLCFRASGGASANWLAVSRRAAGADWHALRATLFAPGPPAPGPDSGGDARS